MNCCRALVVWLLLLVPQGLLWAWIIKTVPRIRVAQAQPHFSIDRSNEQISLQYRISGSFFPGPGQSRPIPTENMWIDLSSCEFHRATSTPNHSGTQFHPTTRFGPRVLTYLPQGKVRVAAHDVTSGQVLNELELDFPGSYKTLVGFRFVVGIDDEWIYVWDAERPQNDVRRYPSPLDSAKPILDVAGTDNFYTTQPIMLEGEDPPTPQSQAPSTSEPTHTSDAASESDPFATLQNSNSPFPIPSVTKQPRRNSGTSTLHLFRLEPDTEPRKLASWVVLSQSNGRQLDADSAATQVDTSIASIHPEGTQLEFHSAELGTMIRGTPFPDDFDPRTKQWSFDQGRIHLGSSYRGPLFDLKSNDWFGPGKAYSLVANYAGSDIALFTNQPQSNEYVFFDCASDQQLVAIPAGRGIPLLYDEQTAAVCSTHFGFTVSLIDFASGRVKKHCSPLRWLPTVCLIAIVIFIGWSAGWMFCSTQANTPAWLDPIVIGGAVAAMLLLRCNVVIRADAAESTTRLLGEHYLRAICTSTLILTGWIVGCSTITRHINRLTALLCVLAALATVMGRLHVIAILPENAGDALDYRQNFYDTWEALTCIFAVVAIVFPLFIAAYGIGFRCFADNAASYPAQREDSAVPTKQNLFRCSTRELLVLTTACAWMLLAWSPTLAHANEELQGLKDNHFFQQVWKPLLVTGGATAIVAFMALSSSKTLVSLASITTASLLVLLIWEPLARFTQHNLNAELPFDFDLKRFAMATVFATSAACLILRIRGWKLVRNRQPMQD